MSRNVLYALMAATLFGASIPFTKLLVGEIPPVLLAGLLYLGSGAGLVITRMTRDRGWKPSGLTQQEWPWFLGAIFFGGVLGPVALLFGLTYTSGSTAALLLNLEAVLTALIAWIVFKENANRRMVLGMLVIVAGGTALSWANEETRVSSWLGPLAIATACLCWAIDNNLTRKVSVFDALYIAGSKGLIAGLVNCSIAVTLGVNPPSAMTALATMLVGLVGYGISLVMFVLALRGLGAARTGAYFSTAPFIGAVVALVLLGESTTPMFWLASTLMSLGIWLHVTEQHEHEHTHELVEHQHPHLHDEHHQHLHGFDWDRKEPHCHAHKHTMITHKHPHFPDTDHRHAH